LVVSYDIVGSVTQANAQGFRVQLFWRTSTTSTRTGGSAREMCTITTPPHAGPSQVFVKRIIASDYIITKKDWPDLRRTLMYARTEVRLYAELFPMMLAVSIDSTRLSSRMRLTWLGRRPRASHGTGNRIWITTICWIQLPREVS
jgi:hypothetical protein